MQQRTAFQVSHLKEYPPTTAFPGTNPPSVPQHLVYERERPLLGAEPGNKAHEIRSERTAVATDTDVTATLAVTQQPAESNGPPDELLAQSVPTQSLAASGKRNTHAGSGWRVTTALRRSSDRVDNSQVENAQSSIVGEMRDAFHAMVQPSQVTQGDTQTQEQFRLPRAASLTTVSPSRGEPSPSPPKKGPAEDARFELSQTTVARLERNKKTTAARTKSKATGARRRDQQITKCECGHTKEEDDMAC